MDLNEKIEEIRRKPEHIRLRYVWGGVAISMFFIIIIWIFSLSDSINKMKPTDNGNLPDIKQSLDEMQSLKETTPSISEIAKDLEIKGQNLTNEGTQSTENIKNNPEATNTLPSKQ